MTHQIINEDDFITIDNYKNEIYISPNKHTIFSQKDDNALTGNFKIIQHDEKNINNKFDIVYIPTDEEVELSRDNICEQYLILSFNMVDNIIDIYPKVTILGERFLLERYHHFKKISFKGFCNNSNVDLYNGDISFLFTKFPRGFTKILSYGLGLATNYSFLINAIHDNDSSITSLCIHNDETKKIENTLYINVNKLETLIIYIDRITRNGQSVSKNIKYVDVYNFISDFTKKEKIAYQTPKSPLKKLFFNLITDEDKYNLSNDNIVVKNFTQNHPDIAENIKNNIEITKFEVFVKEFAELLSKKHKEEKWQTFLNKNSGILSIITGCPIVKIQEQASVGGKKLDGTSEKIADFLVKNSISNNVAIIEIKKPSTTIIKSRKYREGVFIVDSEITGGITQVLDQKYQLNKQALYIKDNSKIDFETYNINCFLVAGMMPTDDNQKKSFELFRSNLKDVKIVTFDELYKFINDFYTFLKQESRSPLDTTPNP